MAEYKEEWSLRGGDRRGIGAGNEIRTRDFNLGKVALYHWVIPAHLLQLEDINQTENKTQPEIAEKRR